MASRGYWTQARRRAFKKMQAAAKRARNPKRRRRRTTTTRRKRRGPARRKSSGRAVNITVRNPPMYAAVANPTRRRRRRRKATRRRSIRRRSGSYAAGRHRGRPVVYFNRRRNPGYRRRRRNPTGGRGLGGLLKRALGPAITGFVTGGVCAVIDNGLKDYRTVRGLVKVGGILVIAGTLGKRARTQNVAAASIGALTSSMGYEMGANLAGGIVAHGVAETAEKVQNAAAKGEPGMGALLTGGMGALLTGPEDVDTAVYDYQTALHNYADDDDDA